MNRMLSELKEEVLKSPDIIFALQLKNAYEIGNVFKIFQAYKNSKNMTSYLLELFLQKLRIFGLQIITKR